MPIHIVDYRLKGSTSFGFVAEYDTNLLTYDGATLNHLTE